MTNLQKDEVTRFKYLNFKLLSSDAPLNIFRIGGGELLLPAFPFNFYKHRN